MVNSSVLISATITMAAVICGVVIFSMENPNAVSMSNSEPLGAKSKWLISWSKERLQQIWTIDLSGLISGKSVSMLVETVEHEWKTTQVFKDNKMISFEGLSPLKALSMCNADGGADAFGECLAGYGKIKDNCQTVDADLSYMVSNDQITKPIEGGIRRTKRRALESLSLHSRKLQTDEEMSQFEADLAASNLSEEEKQAIRDCVMSGASECDEAIAGDHEDAFEEEDNGGALEPITLENGQVIENAIIIGEYVVQLDDDNVPVNIISGADGHILAEIVGIHPLTSIDETRLAEADTSCDAAVADAGDRVRRVEEKKIELSGMRRELGFTGYDGETYDSVPESPYGWCGPGTDVLNTPCPNTDDQLQYVC